LVAAGVEFAAPPRTEGYGKVAVFLRYLRQPLGPAGPGLNAGVSEFVARRC
jgi:hypothetical protein